MLARCPRCGSREFSVYPRLIVVARGVDGRLILYDSNYELISGWTWEAIGRVECAGCGLDVTERFRGVVVLEPGF